MSTRPQIAPENRVTLTHRTAQINIHTSKLLPSNLHNLHIAHTPLIKPPRQSISRSATLYTQSMRSIISIDMRRAFLSVQYRCGVKWQLKWEAENRRAVRISTMRSISYIYIYRINASFFTQVVSITLAIYIVNRRNGILSCIVCQCVCNTARSRYIYTIWKIAISNTWVELSSRAKQSSRVCWMNRLKFGHRYMLAHYKRQ